MKVLYKPTGVVSDVSSKVMGILLARSEGNYEKVEEPKAKKKDENTKSERGSSDSQ